MSYTICSRFKGEHIVYAGYTICTSREHIVYGAFCGSTVHIFWARLASFGPLGIISDPLIVSKFHNKTHDSKGQENKIYTKVEGRETFYHRHTVPVTSWNLIVYNHSWYIYCQCQDLPIALVEMMYEFAT